MLFYLSLGSNIEPEKSSFEMLCRLCKTFGVLGVFPFRYTEPVSISTASRFVNGLVVLHYEAPAASLKAKLEGIEITMGRDRSDPQRSNKDRTADLDILASSEHLDLRCFSDAEESYVRAVFNLLGEAPDLTGFGLASYQRPASVHFDALAGEIVVIEDELQSFHDRVEATLKVQ